MAKLFLKTLDLEQSKQLAHELAQGFADRQIILLSGDLGAGKTQWVQFFSQSLNPAQVAFSPTFGVINDYSTGERKIYHVDLYRLDNEDDIASVGFWDLFAEPQAIVFIEWPERLNRSDLPRDWPVVEIKIRRTADERRREVSIS